VSARGSLQVQFPGWSA